MRGKLKIVDFFQGSRKQALVLKAMFRVLHLGLTQNAQSSVEIG
jgi:hypothetical protein